MKIKIQHIPNTYNYGSLMMAITTLNKLDSKIEALEFYVDTASVKDFDRLKKETGIRTLKSINKKEILNNNQNMVKKIKEKLSEIKKEKALYDIKIILGGDDISEYYGISKWKTLFPRMYLEAINIPTVLLGQSIGPFTGYRKLLAKLTLNKAKIYVRDNHCLSYLKELGVKTASNGRDLAFLELTMQEKAKWILEKYKLNNNNYVTIVPSGLTKCYTNNLENYINEQVNIVNSVLYNERLKGKKIVLLSHVLRPAHVDDRNIIKEIVKRIDKTHKSRILAIEDELLASEAREILGNGLFTITGRMHAAVSTFFMRKPAISLSYSVKYGGVIGDGLDMSNLIIECANNEIWESKNVSKLVSEKVDYVLDNYDELIKKIDINVSETSKITEEQLDDLVEFIKDIQDKKKY